MKSQITMKDIADHFGMSLNTIHKAISGKPGVSDATRKKILKYAEENGYQLNEMASILKRRQLSVTICLPQPDESNRYFYPEIWSGCREYLREWSALNIHSKEISFPGSSLSETLSFLAQDCQQGHRVDGLLTVPPRDASGMEALRRLSDLGVSTVFVTEDNPHCRRLGAVTGDYYAAGQLMAEQISHLLKPDARIGLMAGDEYNEAHYAIAKGFHEYMRQNCPSFTITNLYGYTETAPFEEQVLEFLSVNAPDAMLSVFARGSAVLSRALKKSGMAGKIPAIANDVFPENIDALKDGTFINLVFKDPFRQAYLATKMLCEYLVKEMPPEDTVQTVESRLVFCSTLKYYLPSCT